MANALEVSQQIKATLTSSINEIIQHLPSIAGALLLLAVGWIVALFIHFATRKLMAILNKFLERILSGRTRIAVRFSGGITRLVAGVLFWVTFFIFTTASLRIAGLTDIASWLEQIGGYLPSILSGGIIILVGYVLSSLVRNTTLAAAQSAELSEAELVSRLAQAITFITALMIGMNQLGIDVTFLTIMLGVCTASLLIGFAIAFGLGAKTLVSNLIAAYYIRDHIEPGQTIRIGDLQGTVLEVSSTTIIIDTPQGRTSIPTKRYQEENVTVLMETPNDE